MRRARASDFCTCRWYPEACLRHPYALADGDPCITCGAADGHKKHCVDANPTPSVDDTEMRGEVV